MQDIRIYADKSVSVLELLIVLLIVTVLATAGLPQYTKYIEQHRFKEAETNLELIYNAQTRYGLNNGGKYYICKNSPCTMGELADTNGLGMEIGAHYFEYFITTPSPGNTTFTAQARRLSGVCLDKNMTITQDDGPVNKGDCSAWQ